MENPFTVYYRTGEIYTESWSLDNNQKYKIYYHKNGKRKSNFWTLNGKYHRISEPAYFDYHESGNIFLEAWYQNGELHRTNGPAFTLHNEKGIIESEIWCLNGKVIYPQEWLEENRYTLPLKEQQEIELILRFA